MKIIVLGAGLVGAPMAFDLARDGEFEVTVADRDERALARLARGNPKIRRARADFSDPSAVEALVAEHDLVLSAVPGFLGYRTLQAIIAAGKNVVDIAFFGESPFDLDARAKEKGVTAIVDCGVAPGLSNLLVGHVEQVLERTESVRIYVGGLPEVREWPFEYKAVFSPIDVIEEYTRPARLVENGRPVVREALSDPERLDFPGIGTLEAFNSDGLRTLADTIDAAHMTEKTLRYQGHIEKIALLRAMGLFDAQEIEVKGVKIRPIDFTAKLLFPMWELKAGERDLTVMRVIVEGMKDGKRARYVYDLLDRYDPLTQTHSMARTTGYTATMAIRMLGAGLYNQKGISPPEFVGRDGNCFDFMLKGLEARGVVLGRTIEER
jgi:saccharopine dehydrogenase-like NADP-dependent oxidoreductase